MKKTPAQEIANLKSKLDEALLNEWFPWFKKDKDKTSKKKKTKKKKKKKAKITDGKIEGWSPKSKGLPVSDKDCAVLLSYIKAMHRFMSTEQILIELGLNEMLYNKLIERVPEHEILMVSPIWVENFRRSYELTPLKK